MSLKVVFVVLLGICLAKGSQSNTKRRTYEDAINFLTGNALFRPTIAAHEKALREAHATSQYHPERAWARFSCSGAPSPTVPTSVHKLRPGDIKVVAALGDSLTAASCADSWTILTCTTNYRGSSWSIGGDRSVNNNGASLPNILKVFNPNVYGFSSGSGDRDSSGSRMNVARAGDESRHMYEQAVMLVNRMQNNANINFNEDWKLVTLFIGGNDLCRFCGNEADFTGTLYGSRVEDAISYLYNNLPKAIVQVTSIFDIGPLHEMGGFICSSVHIYACDCVRTNREKITLLTREFQLQLQQITSKPEYNNHEDFTVVYQPFFEQAQPPRKGDGTLDTSFFAADCFHFSRKGHHMAAANLWNAMFQNSGEKELDWEFNPSLYCPASNEYIRTAYNGNGIETTQ